MEIQDDRWGCWISLKELARLKLVEELLSKLIHAMDGGSKWNDFLEEQVDIFDELIEQMRKRK